MTHEELIAKLKELGLVDEFNQPLRFNAFKNNSSITKYSFGGRPTNKILFIGRPKENLFAFYLELKPDAEFQKEAYKIFSKLVAGDMSYMDESRKMLPLVLWGNSGIPLLYQKIYYREKKVKLV